MSEIEILNAIDVNFANFSFLQTVHMYGKHKIEYHVFSSRNIETTYLTCDSHTAWTIASVHIIYSSYLHKQPRLIC